MRRLLILLALASSAFGQSLTYTPRAVAAYMSPDGTNWNPLTTAGNYGMLAYTPYAVGLYCQTAANAAWSPCVFSGGSSGVSSFNTRTGAVTPQTGDYNVNQVTGAAPLASPSFTGTVTAPSYTFTNGTIANTFTSSGSTGQPVSTLANTYDGQTIFEVKGGAYTRFRLTEQDIPVSVDMYIGPNGALNWITATAYLFDQKVTAPLYHETLTTPASSSAACSAGDFTDDANYHYVCTATNTWKRVALSTF